MVADTRLAGSGPSPMSRSPTESSAPYRVTFSAEAWKQVGRMSSGAFFALQAALERIADKIGTERPEGEGAHSKMRTDVAGFRVIYQRDDETRTLTLVHLQPLLSSEPQ